MFIDKIDYRTYILLVCAILLFCCVPLFMRFFYCNKTNTYIKQKDSPEYTISSPLLNNNINNTS